MATFPGREQLTTGIIDRVSRYVEPCWYLVHNITLDYTEDNEPTASSGARIISFPKGTHKLAQVWSLGWGPWDPMFTE